MWCPYSMYVPEVENRISLYFGMHDHESGKNKKIIDKSNYPLKEIIEKFNSTYFNNTISYMLAYAIYTEVEEITMYGIDMNAADEYYAQRGSVMYWIGYARAKGIKVNMINQLDIPTFLYGFGDAAPLKEKLRQMKQWATMSRDSEKDDIKKNQYVGFIHAINLIEKEI